MARRDLNRRLDRLDALIGPMDLPDPSPDPAGEERAERARAWCERADQMLSPRCQTILAGWLAGLAEAVDLDDGGPRIDGLLRPGAELLLRIHRGVEPSDEAIAEVERELARAIA